LTEALFPKARTKAIPPNRPKYTIDDLLNTSQPKQSIPPEHVKGPSLKPGDEWLLPKLGDKRACSQEIEQPKKKPPPKV